MASEKEAEQSALINLESLEVRKSRPGAGPGFEESGLIDLSGFTGGGPTETRATAGVPSGGPMVAGFVVAPKQSNNSLLIVLGVIVLAILVAVAVFVGMILGQGDQPPQPAIAQGQPAAAQPAAPAAPPPAPAAAASPETAAAPSPDGGAVASADAGTADAGSAPIAEASKPATSKSRRASPRRAPPRPSAAPTPPPSTARVAAAEDAPPPAAAPPKPAPPKPAPPKKEETSEVDDLLGSLNGKKPAAPAGGSDPVAAPADPMLPERLTRRQILTVVKRNAGGVRKCKAQPPGAAGTVTVKMQIASNGSVSSAAIASGPIKGTAQGNCVERTVKVFRFPQFSGDPMQINMPFAM